MTPCLSGAGHCKPKRTTGRRQRPLPFECRNGCEGITGMEKIMRLFIALLICALAAPVARTHAADTDWQSVDQIFSRKPAAVSGDVRRYGFPRTDLNFTLDGVTI